MGSNEQPVMSRSKEEPKQAVTDGSIHGYETLESLIKDYIPADKLQEVFRILHGYNGDRLTAPVSLPDTTLAAAQAHNFDLQAYRFTAAPEQLRAPRVVRVGLIQNAVVLPTTAPYAEQLRAIMDRVGTLVATAGACGVNIMCLQEAWHMPFAFCTRERSWSEFAEPVSSGPATTFIQELARRHNMVIVSPILERDEEHGGTIWNTAVVVGNHGNVIGKHRKAGCPPPTPAASHSLRFSLNQGQEGGESVLEAAQSARHPGLSCCYLSEG